MFPKVDFLHENANRKNAKRFREHGIYVEKIEKFCDSAPPSIIHRK